VTHDGGRSLQLSRLQAASSGHERALSPVGWNRVRTIGTMPIAAIIILLLGAFLSLKAYGRE